VEISKLSKLISHRLAIEEKNRFRNQLKIIRISIKGSAFTLARMQRKTDLYSARQFYTTALFFHIGLMNIFSGASPWPLEIILHLTKLIHCAESCHYHDTMAPITPGLL
jgi:hypothetical protein